MKPFRLLPAISLPLTFSLVPQLAAELGLDTTAGDLKPAHHRANSAKMLSMSPSKRRDTDMMKL